jgi:hypothetical protein
MNKLFATILAASTLVCACSTATATADTDVPEIGTVEADMRALAPSELVGTIVSGQTLQLNYPASPVVTYRALSFTLPSEGTGDVTVIAPAGFTGVVAIVDPSGRVVDGWRSGERFAGSARTAFQSGTYRIVVRERQLRAATFSVSFTDVTAKWADGHACTVADTARCQSARCNAVGAGAGACVASNKKPLGAQCTQPDDARMACA